MQRRHVLLAMAGLALTGCQTVPPPSLSVEQSGRFRITEVKVTGIENIRSWPAAAKAYAAQAGLTGEAALWAEREPGKRPKEVDAFFSARLTQLVEARARTDLAGIFKGAEPARLVFRVNALIVPSMAERVLVDNTADLNATIEVVEVATGKVVLSLADRPTFEMMLGGVAAPVVDTVAGGGDPVPAMVGYLMTSFAAWVSAR